MQANSLVQRVMKGALVLLVVLEIGACWSTVVSGDRSPVCEMKCKSSNAGEAVPNQGAAWLFFLLKGDELDVFVLKLCLPACHLVI